MNRSSLSRSFVWEDRIFLFAIAFGFLVFYYHLGLMPLLDDESTRALVSLEMVLSGNYVVPTTHGVLYQNKPPLFNWFIAVLMNADNNFSELSLRLPSMLAFLATSIAIYLFFRRELSPKTALITALAYLTCGRILFYDSMLGYIDPFFTLVLFLDVILLYQFTKDKSTWWIFIGSYSLCLIAYLLKGLPAIVFHGFTLLAALFITRKPKLLFSLSHLAGLAVFLLFLAAYYFAYSQQQDVSGLLATLWEQSSKRTVAEFTWQESLEYVLTFPFQFITHFLPWTLLVFSLFSKQAVSYIRHNTCLAFCALVFLFNITVYWISPETRPRYLFVLLPFFFAVTTDVFQQIVSQRVVTIAQWTVLVLSLACALAVWAPLFVPALHQIHLSWAVCLLSFAAIGSLSYFIFRDPSFSFVYFAFVLLCVRFSFNHFILPARKAEAPESVYKSTGIKIGTVSGSTPIHLLESSIDHDLAYYISFTNRKILDYTQEPPREGDYYICSEEVLKNHNLSPELTFKTSFQNATLFLARKK